MIEPALWVAGILLMIAGYAVLIFITAILERRTTRPYEPVSDAAGGGDFEYLTRMSAGLIAQGFTLVGLARQTAWMINARFAIWRSADGVSLAIVGAAIVARNPAAKTGIYSKLADGRYLLTMDSNDAGELSGLMLVKRHVGGNMEKLLQVHQKRLATFPEVVPWPENATVETANDLLERRNRRIVERGRAYWLDSDCRQWRHTAWGAALCCGHYFKQLGEALMTPSRYLKK